MNPWNRKRTFSIKSLIVPPLYSFLVVSMDGQGAKLERGCGEHFRMVKGRCPSDGAVAFTFIKNAGADAAKIQRRRSKEVMTNGQAILP